MRCSQITSSPAAIRLESMVMAEGTLGDGQQCKLSGSTSTIGAGSNGEGLLPNPPAAGAARAVLPAGGSVILLRTRENTSGHDADDEGGSQGGSSDDGDEVGSSADKPAEYEGDSGTVVSADWPSFKVRRELSRRSRQSRGSAGTGGGGSAHSTPREGANASGTATGTHPSQCTARGSSSAGTAWYDADTAWYDADAALRKSFTLLPELEEGPSSANRQHPPKSSSGNSRETANWKGMPALDLDLGVVQQGLGAELMPLFASGPSFDSASIAANQGSQSDVPASSSQNPDHHVDLLPSPPGNVSGQHSSAPASEHADAGGERSGPFRGGVASAGPSRQQSRGRSRRAALAVFPWQESDPHGTSPSSPGSVSDDNPLATSPQPRRNVATGVTRLPSSWSPPRRDSMGTQGGSVADPVVHPPSSKGVAAERGAEGGLSGRDHSPSSEQNVESEPSAFDLTECDEADSADGGDIAPFLLDLSPPNVAIADADSPTVGGPIGTGGRRVFLSGSRGHGQMQPPHEGGCRSAPLERGADEHDDMHSHHASADSEYLTLAVARPVIARPRTSPNAERTSTTGPLPGTTTSASTDSASTLLPSADSAPQILHPHRSNSTQPSSRNTLLPAHPSLPGSASAASSGCFSRPTQRSINLSTGEPDLAAALQSPRRPTSWSPPHASVPILSVSPPPLAAINIPSPAPPTPSGEGGFLPLDDKPEEDCEEDTAIIHACAEGSGIFHASDAMQSTGLVATASRLTDGNSGNLTEPFPSSPDTSFLLQPFPSSSGQLDELGTGDSAPLWHSEAISNSFSAALGSSDLLEGSARLGEVSPQLAILDPVEPLTSRRSSPANPSSPNAVSWGARTQSPNAPFSLPSVSTVGSPTPLAAAASSGASPTAAAGLLRPLQPIITAPAVGGTITHTARSPVAASPSLSATAALAADASNAAASELMGLHSGLHRTTTPTSPNPNWARTLMDGPSHFSSLQSSPAFSQRSPSALAVTPTGSSSSLRHGGLSPQRGDTPSGLAIPTSPVPPAPADYDPNESHECLWLPIFHRSRRTGLEGHKEFVINIGDVIAQRCVFFLLYLNNPCCCDILWLSSNA